MERITCFALVGVAVIAMFVRYRRSARLMRRQNDSFIATGLKVVDLFAPLPRGGDILMTGGPGTGLVVLGLELVRRLLNHPTEVLHVGYFLDECLSDLNDRRQEMAEVVPEFLNHMTVSAVSEEQLEKTMLESGSRHTVIFAASDNHRFLRIFRDVIRHVRENSSISNRLTTITLTSCSDMAEFDARIECTRMIAQQGIFPAIDVSASHSSVYNAPKSLRRQRQVAEAVTEAITELMNTVYEGAVQDPSWAYNQDAEKRPALQSLCFMSQAFFTAEPYTGKKGTYVSIADTVNDFEIIISGRKKGIASRQFMYCDSLPKE